MHANDALVGILGMDIIGGDLTRQNQSRCSGNNVIQQWIQVGIAVELTVKLPSGRTQLVHTGCKSGRIHCPHGLARCVDGKGNAGRAIAIDGYVIAQDFQVPSESFAEWRVEC